MIVGFSYVVSSGDTMRAEWTCKEGEEGDLLGVHVPLEIAPSFEIVEFDLRRGDGDLERMINSKESVTPYTDATGKCLTCGFVAPSPRPSSCAKPSPGPSMGTSMVGGYGPKIVGGGPACYAKDRTSWGMAVDAGSFREILNAHPPEWDVNVGDVLIVRAFNCTPQAAVFKMGVRLSDPGPSRSRLWWANAETGSLDRPLGFRERKFLAGTKKDGLVVVDPETYEGFK